MSQPTIPLQRQPPAPPVFARIGIYGLGLIGGSIALAARQLWPASLVIAVDNKDVLETAMRLQAIDVAADDPIVLAEVDLVILAAPVKENIAFLTQIDDYVRERAVVTDVGSTKRAMLEAARTLPARFAFVGGHPIAGAAVSGLEHARPELFRGRPWVLTPYARAGEDAVAPGSNGGESAIEKIVAFVTALGAEPRVMSADAHDRVMAFLSHLPQLTVSALMQAIGGRVGAEGLALAGRGLVDTTRLASSPPRIWRDIAETNADEIGAALDALIDALQRMRADLVGGEEIETIFDEARRWRALLKP